MLNRHARDWITDGYNLPIICILLNRIGKDTKKNDTKRKKNKLTFINSD